MKRSLPILSLGVSLTLGLMLLNSPTAAATEPEWYDCRTREVFTPAKRAWCDRWNKIQNGTFIVPASLDPNPEYITVILKNGRYERQDGKFFVELVNQRGWNAFGDLNGDGTPDAAVILGVALDPTGKQIGTYLSAVMNVDSKARAITPVKLGDRILLGDTLKIENQRVIVPFLTQTELIKQVYTFYEGLRKQP
jgi:hypothetical protein